MRILKQTAAGGAEPLGKGAVPVAALDHLTPSAVNVMFSSSNYGPMWMPAVTSWLRVMAVTSREFRKGTLPGQSSAQQITTILVARVSNSIMLVTTYPPSAAIFNFLLMRAGGML